MKKNIKELGCLNKKIDLKEAVKEVFDLDEHESFQCERIRLAPDSSFQPKFYFFSTTYISSNCQSLKSEGL